MKRLILVIVAVIPLLLITACLFYWYQWRPAQIKHQCSWVKRHSAGVPGRPAMTKDELIAKGMIRSCQKDIAALKKVDPGANYSLGDMSVHATFTPSTDGLIRAMIGDPLYDATSCIEDGNKVIADYKTPRKAIPAKDWYEQADDGEYKFCLHDNGL
jgi:hypothetical protein